MDAATFKQYLDSRYYNQLDYYEKASSKNKNNYQLFQWMLIIFSTLTTILAALPNDSGRYKYAIVVCFSALVTILTTALKTFQYQELWLTYRNTIEKLRPELYFYQLNVGEYGKEGIDKEALFVYRIESILNKEHEAWPSYNSMLSEENKAGQNA